MENSLNQPPTDDDRSERLIELFEQACQLAPEKRAAFLAEACGADLAMRREIESLLEHADESAPIIATSAMNLAARQLAAEQQAWSGQLIGHYRIGRVLGEGGMGKVYLAEDTRLKRQVAIKFLPAVFTADAERVHRFEQEARAASALNHPNIITIYEVGEVGQVSAPVQGNHFIVMEFIEGRTLRELLKEGRLDTRTALDVVVQIVSALKAAHAAWIIHRDIKPENIMVRADGLVKVLDFGIAKLGAGAGESERQGEGETAGRGEGDSDSASTPQQHAAASLTTAGMILGTASYMSPEQARGEELDGRTDLFSLGLVLYEMVTGARLLAGTTRADWLQKLRNEQELQLPSARFEGVPKELQNIIRQALRGPREARYANADAMLADLKKLQQRFENRISRRMVKLSAVIAACALVAVCLAAWLSVNVTWEVEILRDGHTAAVRRAVFSPDGRLLVSVGEDNRVIVWNFARRKQLKTLTDHTGWVTSVAFSPDGKLFATGSNDTTVIVWDAAQFEKVVVLHEHRDAVNALAFSPDGRLLASASSGESSVGSDYRTVLWNVNRWEKVRELPVGNGGGCLLFSRNSRLLTLYEGQWDLTTGQKVSDAGVGGWAEYSPDSKRMVIIDSGGSVNFLSLAHPSELAGRKEIARHFVHQDFGRAVAFSPDGKLVATGSENIALWDAGAMKLLGRFEHDAIVWSVAFSLDGHWLVSTHGDGSILVWDVAQRRRAVGFNGHSDGVRAIAYSPDGKRIASASEDRSVIVWNAETGRKEAVLNGHQTRVIGVVFSPDGKWLASSDQDGNIIRWDFETQQPRLVAKTEHSLCLAVSPDGRWLAVSRGVYESSDGREVFSLWHRPGQEIQFEGTAFSADGHRLAGVAGGKVVLLDTANWQITAQQDTGNLPLISVSFSPDGRKLVTGSTDGTVLLWSVQPLREIAVLGRHTARIKSVAFSPDGQFVASAGDDKQIALWDVSWRRKFPGGWLARDTRIGIHTAPVLALAFSPDGKRLVSGEHDKSVRLYTRRRTLWGRPLD